MSISEKTKKEIKEKARKVETIEYLEKKIEKLEEGENNNFRYFKIRGDNFNRSISRSKSSQQFLNNLGNKFIDLLKSELKRLEQELEISGNYNI